MAIFVNYLVSLILVTYIVMSDKRERFSGFAGMGGSGVGSRLECSGIV